MAARKGTFDCDDCDYVGMTPQGLGSHRFRVHGIRGASANTRNGSPGGSRKRVAARAGAKRKSGRAGAKRKTAAKRTTAKRTTAKRTTAKRTTAKRAGAKRKTTAKRATAKRRYVRRTQPLPTRETLLRTLYPNGAVPITALDSVQGWLDEGERLGRLSR